MPFTLNDFFMGRDQAYSNELTVAMRRNATITVGRANLLLSEAEQAGIPCAERYVTSGWRPMAVNQTTAGAALYSKHLTCEAVDISDPYGDLDEWALNNQGILERVMLWQEHPSATKGWAHFQIAPPRSGNRVFYP